MGKLMLMGTQRPKRIAGRLLKKPFHAILSCEEITEGGGNMLCHLVIDLNKGLCTKSGGWTKLVQR